MSNLRNKWNSNNFWRLNSELPILRYSRDVRDWTLSNHQETWSILIYIAKCCSVVHLFFFCSFCKKRMQISSGQISKLSIKQYTYANVESIPVMGNKNFEISIYTSNTCSCSCSFSHTQTIYSPECLPFVGILRNRFFSVFIFRKDLMSFVFE